MATGAIDPQRRGQFEPPPPPPPPPQLFDWQNLCRGTLDIMLYTKLWPRPHLVSEEGFVSFSHFMSTREINLIPRGMASLESDPRCLIGRIYVVDQ